MPFDRYFTLGQIDARNGNTHRDTTDYTPDQLAAYHAGYDEQDDDLYPWCAGDDLGGDDE